MAVGTADAVVGAAVVGGSALSMDAGREAFERWCETKRKVRGATLC